MLLKSGRKVRQVFKADFKIDIRNLLLFGKDFIIRGFKPFSDEPFLGRQGAYILKSRLNVARLRPVKPQFPPLKDHRNNYHSGSQGYQTYTVISPQEHTPTSVNFNFSILFFNQQFA